jgi:hypothetical protein
VALALTADGMPATGAAEAPPEDDTVHAAPEDDLLPTPHADPSDRLEAVDALS